MLMCLAFIYFCLYKLTDCYMLLLISTLYHSCYYLPLINNINFRTVIFFAIGDDFLSKVHKWSTNLKMQCEKLV